VKDNKNRDLPLAVIKALEAFLKDADSEKMNKLREFLHKKGQQTANPVDLVRWVPVSQVEANDYNPNSVASREMGLLATSIRHDGYTQPVVTIWDEERQKYIIVDGFHRYFVCRTQQDIQEKNHGLLPVVVINADINNRMASTVRHNRARGKHSVKGMANMVFEMLDNGWADADICNEMGMEAEELLRLKHISGFSRLFQNHEYRKAWETRTQILIRKKWETEQREEEKA
jgi:ParB-like chromosome segregation protein Spo0J